MTVGPWKPIRLETYTNRILDLDVRSEVSEDLLVSLSVEASFSDKENYETAAFTLKGPDGSVKLNRDKVALLPAEAGSPNLKLGFKFEKGDVELWYPVGYGAQPIYTVEVELYDAVCCCGLRSRSIELLTATFVEWDDPG